VVRKVFRSIVLGVLLATPTAAAATAPAAAAILPPSNPVANIVPASVTNFLSSINAGRADEGVAPMQFNQGEFDALTIPEQVFVLSNLERTGRGLPPISAMTNQLNNAAAAGAEAGDDPPNPKVLTTGGTDEQGGSIWIGDTSSSLVADYVWMYEDGLGSASTTPTYNIDCSSGLLGTLLGNCWGHRDIILTQYSNCSLLGLLGGPAQTLVMGAAYDATGYDGGPSIAAVFAGTCGPAPTDETFTWAQAEAMIFGPIAGIASMPNGSGFWLASPTGAVEAFGSAPYLGSMGGQTLNAPIVGIVATPDGQGYWLVGSDGGIFSFGDAHFYGSTGNIRLNKPIVGMATTSDGHGYWFVASDGGVFAFGDARYAGSMGGKPLNRPVVGMAEDPATGGYWLVASDGGVFSFDAPFYGSTGSLHLVKPIVAMQAAPDGSGYRFVAADGGIFDFNMSYEGSAAGALNAPVIGIADSSSGGYWVVTLDGFVLSFGLV
jgi:hypothetical protein